MSNSSAKKNAPDDLVKNHQAAIDALVSRDREAMMALALDHKTPPEMLFVLSQTPENRIRKAVAANPSTPSAVNETLSRDSDPQVRAMLIRRLNTLLPDVDTSEQNKLAERSLRLLTTLANDAEVAVRRVLAEEICALDKVPNEIAMQLAQDVDDLVALPIVEFSPVLSDDDLIELVTCRGDSASLSAIARRENLGSDVGDKLVATGDVEAIGALLNNKSTYIREITLDHIVSQADGVEAWHEALCGRPELTSDLALKLCNFVAFNLASQLATRDGFDADAMRTLRDNVSARFANDPTAVFPEDCAVDRPTEDEVLTAIEGRRDAKIYWLLASCSGLTSSVIRRIMSTRDPQVITALAWKSGLSFRAAMMLQRFPGNISDAKLLRAGENGNYPNSEKDMEWQLSTYISETDV